MSMFRNLPDVAGVILNGDALHGYHRGALAPEQRTIRS
jgi:hypothetical protein